MLSDEQKNTLDLMISDAADNKIEEYSASAVLWASLSEGLNNYLNTVGIQNIQNQNCYNDSFSYIFSLSLELKSQIALWLYYNLLKSRDRFGILDKTEILASNNIDIDFTPSTINGRPDKVGDKLINWDYLISLDTIITIAEKYPDIVTEPITVCEVGAGWGRVAYYLTQINNKISYNIFDIPHILLISSEYLRNSTNHTKVFTYQETSKNCLYSKSQLLNNPGITFSLPNKLEYFEKKSFDLFINIASFQEMNIKQIEKYFERVNSLSSYFYTQQRYKDLEMDYTKYPNYNNWTKLLDKDINFHPLWFEQFYKVN